MCRRKQRNHITYYYYYYYPFILQNCDGREYFFFLFSGKTQMRRIRTANFILTMHFRNGLQLITDTIVVYSVYHTFVLNKRFVCTSVSNRNPHGFLCKQIYTYANRCKTDIMLQQTNFRMCQSVQVNLLAIFYRHIGLRSRHRI